MSIYRRQVVLVWKTADGGRITQFLPAVSNPEPDVTEEQDFITAAESLSDAGLEAVYSEPVAVYEPAFGSGSYNGRRDRALFVVRSANGNTRQFRIIAPKEDMFMSDHVRVDLSDSRVIDLLSAMPDALADETGSPYTTIVSAVRSRTRDPAFPG